MLTENRMLPIPLREKRSLDEKPDLRISGDYWWMALQTESPACIAGVASVGTYDRITVREILPMMTNFDVNITHGPHFRFPVRNSLRVSLFPAFCIFPCMPKISVS